MADGTATAKANEGSPMEVDPPDEGSSVTAMEADAAEEEHDLAGKSGACESESTESASVEQSMDY